MPRIYPNAPGLREAMKVSAGVPDSVVAVRAYEQINAQRAAAGKDPLEWDRFRELAEQRWGQAAPGVDPQTAASSAMKSSGANIGVNADLRMLDSRGKDRRVDRADASRSVSDMEVATRIGQRIRQDLRTSAPPETTPTFTGPSREAQAIEGAARGIAAQRGQEVARNPTMADPQHMPLGQLVGGLAASGSIGKPNLNPVLTIEMLGALAQRSWRGGMGLLAGKGADNQSVADNLRRAWAELDGRFTTTDGELLQEAVKGLERDIPGLSWALNIGLDDVRKPEWGGDKSNALAYYATTWAGLDDASAGKPFRAALDTFLFLADPQMLALLPGRLIGSARRSLTFGKALEQAASLNPLGREALGLSLEPRPIHPIEAVAPILKNSVEAEEIAPEIAQRVEEILPMMQEIQGERPLNELFLHWMNNQQGLLHTLGDQIPATPKAFDFYMASLEQNAQLPLRDRLERAFADGRMGPQFRESVNGTLDGLKSRGVPDDEATYRAIEWIGKNAYGDVSVDLQEEMARLAAQQKPDQPPPDGSAPAAPRPGPAPDGGGSPPIPDEWTLEEQGGVLPFEEPEYLAQKAAQQGQPPPLDDAPPLTDADAPPAQEVTGATRNVAPATPSSTGLGELGDAGKAIGENLRAMLWSKVERGSVEELGKPSQVLTLAHVARKRGGLQSREAFDRFLTDYATLQSPSRESFIELIQRHIPPEAGPPAAPAVLPPKAPTPGSTPEVAPKSPTPAQAAPPSPKGPPPPSPEESFRRLRSPESRGSLGAGVRDDQYERAVNYVEKKLRDGLTPQDIAEAADLQEAKLGVQDAADATSGLKAKKRSDGFYGTVAKVARQHGETIGQPVGVTAPVAPPAVGSATEAAVANPAAPQPRLAAPATRVAPMEPVPEGWLPVAETQYANRPVYQKTHEVTGVLYDKFAVDLADNDPVFGAAIRRVTFRRAAGDEGPWELSSLVPRGNWSKQTLIHGVQNTYLERQGIRFDPNTLTFTKFNRKAAKDPVKAAIEKSRARKEGPTVVPAAPPNPPASGITYRLHQGVQDAPAAFDPAQVAQGRYVRLTDRGWQGILKGEAINQVNVRRPDVAPKPGDFWVQLDQDGLPVAAWSWNAKGKEYQGVPDLSERLYAAKIDAGFAVEPSVLERFPRLKERMQQPAAQSARQFNHVAQQQAAKEPPLPVPPRVAETVQAGQLGALDRGHFKALDRAGWHPYYADQARTVDLRLYGVDDAGNITKAPTEKVVLGNPTEILDPRNNVRRGRWVVMELDDVVKSHTLVRGKNPAYPKPMQPRDMESKAVWDQQEVWSEPGTFQPLHWLGAPMGSTEGPPVADLAGRLLNGNRRTVTYELALGKSPESKAQYLDLLKRNSKRLYGIDPESLAGFDKPYVVRIVEEPWDTWGEVFQAVDDMAQQQAAALRVSETAQMDARNLGDFLTDLEWGDAENLMEALAASSNQTRLAGILSRMGNEANGLMTRVRGAGGSSTIHLTDQGKRRIINASLATILSPENLDLLDNYPGFRESLARSFQPLDRMRSAVSRGTAPNNWLFDDGIAAALELLDGQTRTRMTHLDFINTTTMFGQPRAARSARAAILSEFFLTFMQKPKALREALDKLAMGVPSGPRSGSLFGGEVHAPELPERIMARLLSEIPPGQRAIGLDLSIVHDIPDATLMQLADESFGDLLTASKIDAPRPSQEPTITDAMAARNSLRSLEESAELPIRGPHPDDAPSLFYATPAGRAEIKAAEEAWEDVVKNGGDANPSIRPDDVTMHTAEMPGMQASRLEREAGGPVAFDKAGLEAAMRGDPSGLDGPKGPPELYEAGFSGRGILNVANLSTKPFLSAFSFLWRKPQWVMKSEQGQALVTWIRRQGERNYDFQGAATQIAHDALRLATGFPGKPKYIQRFSDDSAYMFRLLDMGKPAYMQSLYRRRAFLQDELDNYVAAVGIDDTAVGVLNEGSDLGDEAMDALADDAGRKQAQLERVLQQIEWAEEQIGSMRDFEAKFPERSKDLQQRAQKLDQLMAMTENMLNRTRDLDVAANQAFLAGSMQRPLSWRMRRLLAGVPKSGKDGRAVIPLELIQLIPDGEINRPFALPRTGEVGYDTDLISSLQFFLPMASRQIFLDPVLGALTRQVQDASGPAARRIKAFEKGSRWAAEVGAEVNPHFRGMPPKEQEYIHAWVDHLKGRTPQARDMLAVDAMERSAAFSHIANDPNAHPLRRKWAGALARELDAFVLRPNDPRSVAHRTAALVRRGMLSGYLGMSSGFYIRNSMQNLTAVSELGARPFMVGVLNFNPITARGRAGVRLVKEMNLARDFTSFVHADERQAAIVAGIIPGDDTPVQKMAAAYTWLNEAVMKPAAFQEFTNRGIAFHAFLSEEFARQGYKTFEDAYASGKLHTMLQDAVSFSHRHHGIYGPLGSNPYVESSALAKTATFLTDYHQNAWELMASYVYSEKNRNGWALMDFVVLTGYLNSLAARSGLSSEEWLGYTGLMPDRTHLLAPTTQNPIFKGLEAAVSLGSQSFLRLRDKVSGGHDFSPLKFEQGMKDFGTAVLFATIPAYGQARRIGATVERSRTGSWSPMGDFWQPGVADGDRSSMAEFDRSALEYLSSLTGVETEKMHGVREVKKAERQGQEERTLALRRVRGKFTDLAMRSEDSSLPADERQAATHELTAKVEAMAKETGIPPDRIYRSIQAGMRERREDIPAWAADILAGDPVDANGVPRDEYVEALRWVAQHSPGTQTRQEAAMELKGLMQGSY